ncbi:heat-inducible transcriptional repressor HrcA [Roseomonas vastitatis]|uniref:Heat-inducible transcription repressor HrcA n=1 Tax=Teichococcus vastitatis TaxID=2307076 RepID=A0ABS9WCA4_9PROT|nr:heat-inducible transcriptional repressor HrcA [Pseudoroseomonas vastitatis]MCI0756857.1 heat-inducible transcriptional repressor HrcA [Pseudoroseomonas vastitatis]
MPRAPTPLFSGQRAELPRLSGLNNRAAAILREVVELYVQTGEPVGSRTLSRRLPLALSPATIRNAMADLEEAGLLYAPHTSAGRLPTEQGLRLFVDGLLEFGDLSDEDRENIAARCAAAGRSMEETLSEAGQMLSGLAGAAGLVVAPKTEAPVKHIEFVALSPGRALVVLVNAHGQVENRVIEVPAGLPPSAFSQASNYLNARLSGRTLEETRGAVAEEIQANRSALDELTGQMVESGLATWSGGGGGSLILRGQSKLLENIDEIARLQEIQALFERLEAQETMLRLLELAQRGQGVQIFIGAESGLFNSAGLSMVVSPFRDRKEQIVGALGVIGPTRINYGRVIPVVDYTARVIGKMLG